MTRTEKLQEAARLTHLSAVELVKWALQTDPAMAFDHAITARMHAQDAQAYLAWAAPVAVLVRGNLRGSLVRAWRRI